MAQVPQYFAPDVNLPSLQPLPDSNAGSAMGKLSQMAASETSELAKKAGADKGAEDQAVAGTNPVTEDKGLFGFIPTDYSETYNKAAKIAFVEAKKSQLENTTLSLQQKYGNDLDQFQSQLSNFRQEFMANVPLKSQPQFDLLFQDHTLRATRAVTDTKLKQDFQQSQGTILGRFDELTNNLTNAIAADPDALGQSTNEYAHNASILLHSATLPTTDPKTGQTYPPVFDAATAERMHAHVMENVSRASVAAKYASLPTIEAKKYFVEEVLSKGGYRLPRMDGLNDSGNAQVPATLAQQLAAELKPKFMQEQAQSDADYFLNKGSTGAGSAPRPAAGFQPVSVSTVSQSAPATTPRASTAPAAPSPDESFAKNAPFVSKDAGSDFQTHLDPEEETKFQQWVKDNKAPFQDGPKSDYDMRGYYKALMAGDTEHTQTEINQNDGKLHYTDYFKTPYHKSFSAGSKFADPTTAPKWNDKDQLVTPDGNVVFDEKAQNAAPAAPPQPSPVIIPPSSRIAYVHNNPGNLKFVGQAGATRGEPASDGGYYAKFVTPEDGLNALTRQVSLDVSRGMTLAQFVTKYAPPTSNDTSHYILTTANMMKTDPNMPINALPLDGLVSTVARFESSSVVGQAAQTRNAIKMNHATTVADIDATLATSDPQRASMARSIVDERFRTVALAGQADYAEKERQAAEDAKAKIAASDAAEKLINQRILAPKEGDPPVTARDIGDPDGPYAALLPAKQHQMVEFVERRSKGDPITAQSHATVVDILKRIRAPEDDPLKIKNNGAIYDAFTSGKLTNNDFQFAMKQYDNQTTSDGEQLGRRKAQFFKGIEPTIDHSNPVLGSIDNTGKLKMYEFEYFVDKKVEEFRAAGKDPHILFNPGTPDNPNKEYVGNYAGMFQKTIQESSDDAARNLSRTRGVGSATTTGGNTPPAKYPDAKKNGNGDWIVVRDGKTYKVNQ